MKKTRISRQDWLITRELCVHSIGGGSGRRLLTFVFFNTPEALECMSRAYFNGTHMIAACSVAVLCALLTARSVAVLCSRV